MKMYRVMQLACAGLVMLWTASASAVPGGNPNGSPCIPIASPCFVVGQGVYSAACGVCEAHCFGGPNAGNVCTDQSQCDPGGQCLLGICPPVNATCVGTVGGGCAVQCNDPIVVGGGPGSVNCGVGWVRLSIKLTSAMTVCGKKEAIALANAQPFDPLCYERAREKYDAAATKLTAKGCQRSCTNVPALRAQAEAFAVSAYTAAFCQE